MELFGEVKDPTWTHVGPIRNAKSLRGGLSRVSNKGGKLDDLKASGQALELNEVKASVSIWKAIMRASLKR